MASPDQIKIDRGVPLPISKAGSHSRKYPFDKMNIGDSFFLPSKEPEKLRTNILNASAHYRKWARKPEDKYFRIKTFAEGAGVRAWRLA